VSTHELTIEQLIDLSGKVAIVTGAAQGLGYACAARLCEAGAAVALNDIDAGRAESAAAELAQAGRRVFAVPGDVTSRDDVQRLVAVTVDACGRVDILINNAGIWPMQPFLETTEEPWERTLRLNVIGTLLCTQAVANRLIEQGDGGAVVNIASIAAVAPHADTLVAYGASKAGVVNLTRSLAKSLAPHGIRVNAILPGGMETPGVQAVAGRRQGSDIPLGHRAHPDEVALAVLFLACGLGGYVTGTDLIVDGGATLV
jgi:NAD(P)-dependent dehydrogenase (short-subunit alcohol dehydrogenase family)